VSLSRARSSLKAALSHVILLESPTFAVDVGATRLLDTAALEARRPGPTDKSALASPPIAMAILVFLLHRLKVIHDVYTSLICVV
jgi:hypothetical protein